MSEFSRGHFPLWNSFNAFGEPHMANMQSAVFYPLNAIKFLNKYIDVFGFIVFLRLFLAYIFTYYLSRTLKLNKFTSILTAISYSLCSYFIVYIYMVHINVEILLPIIIYFTINIVRRPNTKYLAFLAIIIAIGVFGGFPEPLLFCIFFSFLTYVFMVYIHNSKSCSKIIGFLPYFTVIAVTLSAVQLFPFIEYLESSWNYHQTGEALKPISIKQIFSLFNSTYYAKSGYAQFLLPSLLIISLFFALTGSVTRKPFNNLLSIIISILLSLIYGIPPFSYMSKLWPLSVTIIYKYAFPSLLMAVSILFGLTVNKASNIRCALSALFVINTIFLYHTLFKIPQRDFNAASLHAESFIACRNNTVRYAGSRFVDMPNLNLLFYLSDIRYYQPMYLKKYVNFMTKANDLLPEQIPVHYGQNIMFIPEITRLDSPLWSLTGLKYWIGNSYPGSTTISDNIYFHSQIYYSYQNGVFLLDPRKSLTPEEGLFMHSPSKIQNTLNNRSPYTLTFKLKHDGNNSDGAFFNIYQDNIRIFSKHITKFSQSNIGFSSIFEVPLNYFSNKLTFLSNPGHNGDSTADWVKFISPSLMENKLSSYKLVKNGDIPVFENLNVLPRAFIVSDIDKIPSLEQTTPAEITDYQGDSATIRTTGPGYLVLTDINHPGWEAYDNGKHTTIEEAYETFRAIKLDEGKHEILFVYKPKSFKIGLWCSLSSFASVFTLMIFARKRRRQ